MGEDTAVKSQVIAFHTAREPNEKTNPFISLLFSSLTEAGVDVLPFTWRRALFSRYDVVHAHWPEYLLRHNNWFLRRLQTILFSCWLGRLNRLGVPVVSTVHNLQPHETLEKLETRLLTKFKSSIRSRAYMTPDRSIGPDDCLIPHGHYKNWYALQDLDTEPGRVLFFGIIRRYKGLEDLIRVFDQMQAGELTLRIVGRPLDAELAAAVTAAEARNSRIEAILRHIHDEDLTREIEQAILAVLPYKALYNSGALLLALSLNTPVLVPSTPSTEALALEVGPEWVRTYSGELTIERLRSATIEGKPSGQPNLSAREWPEIARQYHSMYLRALESKKN